MLLKENYQTEFNKNAARYLAAFLLIPIYYKD